MRVITLEYHDVVEGGAFDASGFPGNDAASYKMDARDFAAHLDAVAGCGRPVGLDARSLGEAGSPVPVLLTFDDGGVAALEPTATMLERHGWVGHFFVTTDYIGTPGFLSPEDIVALHRRGHVVGSHSASHPTRMARCSRAELDAEWRGSVAVLAALLGAPPTVASVPGGYFSDEVARAAAGAGIRVLFTSEPTTRAWRTDGCLVLGRYTLRRAHAAAVAARLAGAAPVARAGQWLVWNSKKVVKAVAGDLYLRVRQRAFGGRDAGPPITPRTRP